MWVPIRCRGKNGALPGEGICPAMRPLEHGLSSLTLLKTYLLRVMSGIHQWHENEFTGCLTFITPLLILANKNCQILISEGHPWGGRTLPPTLYLDRYLEQVSHSTGGFCLLSSTLPESCLLICGWAFFCPVPPCPTRGPRKCVP